MFELVGREFAHHVLVRRRFSVPVVRQKVERAYGQGNAVVATHEDFIITPRDVLKELTAETADGGFAIRAGDCYFPDVFKRLNDSRGEGEFGDDFGV